MKLQDKWVCKECGKRYNKKTGKCLACGSFDIEELNEPEVNESKVNLYEKKVSFESAGKVLSSTGTALDTLYTFPEFPGLNNVLSTEGGILNSQVVLLAASPGTGKTTMCSQMANENTLFISSEETAKQVSQRFKRCNGNMDAKIFESVNDMEILSAIAQTDCDLIVLDSLNSIENDNGGIASYAKVADIAQKITHLIKSQKDKAIIIISQVTKNNNIIGMESIVHGVDTVLHMERSSTSDKIILTSSKNRFGSVGEIMFLKHGDNGLTEVDNDCGSENTVGTTIFKMVSGSKKIPMEIQALIVPTEDKPMKRSVGVSFNKMCLVDAILRSNDPKYNTKYSDIYMSTSNGLFLPEGNDIVIANSLLSAYYNKVIENNDLDMFSGMLNLNGNIVGSKRFRHIRDLIGLYH